MASAFAGPLSRFYGQGVVQADKLRAGVVTWRDDLRASVADKVRAQLDWDEGADVAIEHDLGDAGWMALRLFAFYAERADLEMPDTVPALLELDQEWRRAVEAKFAKSLYGQLLAATCWLPGEFPVTLRVPMPDGGTAEIGSLAVLADQLKWLNQRTFAADQAEVVRWLDLPAPPGGSLLDAARRGFGALSAGVALARQYGVPLAVREV